MNINKAIDKVHETKSLHEILKEPISSLQGVTDADAEKLQSAFGIKTIRDLGTNKFFLRAHAIVQLAESEQAQPER